MQEIDRTRRVGHQLQRELGTLINTALNDPRVSLVSVTSVEVSRDLKQAKVFVSSLGANSGNSNGNSTEDDQRELMQALEKAKGYLRRELSHRVNLRYTPALRFVYDSSIEKGVALSGLISDVMQKETELNNSEESDS